MGFNLALQLVTFVNSCDMLLRLKLLLFLILTLGTYVECLKVIFERANVTYFNKKYMSSMGTNIRRYSRISPYYLNIFGTTEHRWENNITVDIIFNQYLHNEYRRSFIEFHYKFCDLINKEPYIGGMMKYAGLICPLNAGPHAYMNMTAPTNNFPNVFPFEKGRVDATLSITATKEPVFTLFVEASFKN